MLRKKVGLDQVINHIKDRRVLMRVDFNVAMDAGKVTDTRRISESLPTIKKILDSGAKNLVLMSHLGRPNGKKNSKYSMKPVVPVLEQMLGKKVRFIEDCVGPQVEEACANAKNGEIIVLENLRFYAEEEGSFKDDSGNKVKIEKDKIQSFRNSLSKLGDVYVNDAFGAAHRAHSSIVGVNLPLRAAGLLMKKELDVFGKVLEDPARPFLLILGGAKVHDKIPLLNNMIDKVDEIIVGGGVSYTFLKKVYGMEIGQSLFDKTGFEQIDAILNKAKEKGVKIHMPLDLYIAEDTKGTNKKLIEIPNPIDPNLEAFDGGNKTKERNHRVITNSKTVIWNGPQGFFENPGFRNASYGVLDSMIECTKNGGFTIAGGGETGACIMTKPGADKQLSHVSTGGGATLELLEGKVLPGVDFLTNVEDLAKIKL